MAPESIFTSQTPTVSNANDATQYTLGTVWTPAVDGIVTHIRVYAPTGTPASSLVGVLYSVTSNTAGVELKRATFGALTPSAWNVVALPGGGQAVIAGAYYCAAYLTPDLFVLHDNTFTAAGIINGNLTAIQSGSPYGNGRLHVGDGFPEITSGNKASYFADVVFTAGGAVVQASAALAAGSAMSAAAVRLVRPSAALAAVGALSAAGTRVATASASLTAQSGLSVGSAGPVGPRIVASSRPGRIVSSSSPGRITRGGGA
jgi:hypothetical protein